MPLYSKSSEILTLPNGGQLTSFQKHVPALIVGAAEEWDRMSKKIYEFHQKNGFETYYSDRLALRDIQEETMSCIFDKRF